MRNPTHAAAASATWAFSIVAVPKRIAAETSTTSQASRSRSAIWSRTWVCIVRAVTFQSMRRTSSPGWYRRDSPGSEPWPGVIP